MSEPVRIFVDGKPLAVAPGTTVARAVTADDQDLSAALAEGRAYVTDGVGRPIDTAAAVVPGAIFRVIRSATRRPSAE